MHRISLPMILPVAVAALVGLVIMAIGSLLLWCADEFGEDVSVAVALALGGAVLIGCALAARGGRRETVARH